MLSSLQRYILRELLLTKNARAQEFKKFYSRKKHAPSVRDQQTIITRSLERLIEQGLVVATGRRTRERWFIETVSLTPKGKKEVGKINEQQALPLFTRKRKIHGNTKKS